MSAFPDEDWFRAYQARVNADRELSVIGNWFSARFSITVGDTRRVLTVEKGRISQINFAPRFDTRPALRIPCADGYLVQVRECHTAPAL